jgi:DNA-binding MarR family transcriptional regulator
MVLSMSRRASADAAAGMAVWRAYADAHLRLAGRLARDLARHTGLSEADHQVLDALLDAPGGRCRALELRCRLQWEKSRLSHHLARMVARGLVDRAACTEDGRGADVALTPAGRVAARRAREVRARSVQALVLDTLGPERVAHLAEATTLLARRLSEDEQADPDCRAARGGRDRSTRVRRASH